MSHELIDVFFDISCALTNFNILNHPLQMQDAVFNSGVLNLIMMERQLKEERQKRANELYLSRRREHFDPEEQGRI